MSGWRSPHWATKHEGRCLVEEAEQFLTGTYVQSLLLQGTDIPEWAWVSLLAHTPQAELSGRMDDLPQAWQADPVTVLWLCAVALLAQEVLEVAESNGCTVGELQRALISEFETGRRREGSTQTMGPSRFIQEVRSTLSRSHGRQASTGGK